jgi:hypothetical protein
VIILAHEVTVFTTALDIYWTLFYIYTLWGSRARWW